MAKTAKKTRRRPKRAKKPSSKKPPRGRRPRRGTDLKPWVVTREVGEDLPERVGSLIIRNHTAAFMELIANAYDADAEKVEIGFTPNQDMCYVEDDGTGMSPEEVRGFFRMGDSTKRGEPVSSKGRRRLGSFGLATLSIFKLAGSYSFVSVRDGIESRVEEDLTKPTTLRKKLQVVPRRVSEDWHGTTITMNNLRFGEGKGFRLKDVKRRVQQEYRKLTHLPDFSVIINGEEIKPTIIKKATKFPIDERGKHIGHITGVIYLSKVGTDMSGLHISINGRTIGNPQEMLQKISTNQTIRSRAIVEVEANALERAILLDRSLFDEDHPAYRELMEITKRILLDVRSHEEMAVALNAAQRIKKQRRAMAEALKRDLIGAGVEGITESTVFEFDDSEGGENMLPCSFNQRKNRITIHNSGALHLDSSLKPWEYKERLHHFVPEAIAFTRAEDTVTFLEEREQISSGIRRTKRVSPRITGRAMYTSTELAGLSGLNTGSVRYMEKGGLFPKSEEGTILGSDFTEAKRKTAGMITLYDFLSNMGHSNLLPTLIKYTRAFQKLGKKAEPFVVNKGSKKGEPCYFVERTCVTSLKEMIAKGLFDGRKKRGMIAAGNEFSALRSTNLTTDEIARASDNLPRRDVKAVIRYGLDREFKLRAKEGKFNYGTFVEALQSRNREKS
jgi:hypothetical protein